jgi:hypothetical protein
VRLEGIGQLKIPMIKPAISDLQHSASTNYSIACPEEKYVEDKNKRGVENEMKI